MGKKRRIKTGAGDVVSTPGPLHKQIEKSALAKQKFKPHKEFSEADKKNDKFVDANLSSKILLEAQKQWREEEVEDGDAALVDKEEEFDTEAKELADHLDEIDPEEEADFDQFETARKVKIGGQTIYDVIQRKKQERAKDPPVQAIIEGVDPTVVTLYTEIGQLLAKYRSGKVPKAFKIIPVLAKWEQILELTRPDGWTSAAMLYATRIFSATGTPAQCQRFYNLVVLPRVRDEIDEFKKLNVHMYQCLSKAIFKPAAFFKGILLPLCRSGTCTLREAVIFGSVLRKISIPQLHAAAAMLSIAEIEEYNGASSFLLRVLIEKHYTLPFRALDGLVFHFLRMRSHQHQEDGLPVIWHQCLLAFVQTYAKDVSGDQREALLELTKTQSHHKITPEVQRALRSAESRNTESEANVPDYARDEEMDF